MIAVLDLDHEVLERYDSILNGETMEDRGRLHIYLVTLKAAGYYFLTGSGLGTYGYSTLPFFEDAGAGWHRYAESIWGHLIVELGWFGTVVIGLCLLEFRSLFKVAFKKAQSGHYYLIPFALSFGLTYTLIHSAVDFRLIIPAVYFPSAILLGALYGTLNQATPKKEPRSKSTSKTKIGKESTSKDALEPRGGEVNPTGDRLTVRTNRKTHSRTIRSDESRRSSSRPFLTRVNSTGPFGLLTLVLIGWILYSSLEPLRLAADGHQLEKNVADIFKQAKIVSPETKSSLRAEVSDLLMDLASLPDEAQTKESLRILAILELQAWQFEFEDRVQEVDSVSIDPKFSNANFCRLRFCESDAEFTKAMARYGAPEIYQRWSDAAEHFKWATQLAPLDWRNNWGALHWEFGESSKVTLGRLNRWRLVAASSRRATEGWSICGVFGGSYVGDRVVSRRHTATRGTRYGN